MASPDPEITATPTAWLAARAAGMPDRVAIRDASRALSYRELLREAATVAVGLRRRGIAAGDRVAIEVEPSVNHGVLLHGVLLARAVAQPLRVELPATERDRTLGGDVAAVLGHSDADSVRGMPVADSVLNSASADEIAVELLTSGTTGDPKRVRLSYGNFLWSAVGSAFSLGIDPGDVWLCCLPLNHVGGLAILFRSVIYGTAAELHPRFDVDAVAEALERDVSLVSLVPTQLRRLIDAGAPLDRARALVIGGAPVSEELLREATEAGACVVQTYGMTETASQVATLGPADAISHRGSAGRAAFATEIRIEEGGICVRGPIVAPASRGEDGWLRTGDLGRIDEDGYLWVEGRGDDLIISGGENVHPAEVESVLETHPAVVEAAVIGRPDPEWGSAVTAVIVLADGATVSEEELRSHCRAQLAAYKVPKRIEFTSELPRTAGGKLIRQKLG